MFIAKIVIPATWTKVEDLIKEAIGDNSFAFSSNKYILQAEADSAVTPVRLCDLDSAPTESNAGLRLVGTQVAIYEKGTCDLYCKVAPSAHKVYLSVNELGV